METTEDNATTQKESKTKMRQRHRNELKELKIKIDALNKTAKKDKQAKTELAVKQKQLEDDIKKRHEEEEKSLANSDEESLEAYTANLTITSDSTKKLAKKHQKKNKRLQQEHDKIKQLEKEKLSVVSYRELENSTLSEKLSLLGFSIKEIPPDGNCLFNAIADQMIVHPHHIKADYLILRKQAADYIISHPDDFLPFLQLGEDIPDGMPTVEHLEKYCEDLCSTNNWGGQLEIMALCHALSTPIIVHSAEQPDVSMGEEYSADRGPLHLSYHKHAYALGEHYNSVVPKDSEEY